MTSIQGRVELRHAASSGWRAAKLDDPICAGDMLRVGGRSRAALLLSNETTLRLDQNTALTVPVPEGTPATLLDVLTGAINVISRTPHPFRVQTPYVNASIEGTEFLVGVTAGSARVAVFEGRVVAGNERGSVTLAAGEQAVAAKDSAPLKEVVVRPAEAVQWALYFPTLFNYAAATAEAQDAGGPLLRESVELYRSGHVAEAIAKLQGQTDLGSSTRLLNYHAGLLLQVGRLDEARPDLERARALDPRSSDAAALGAVIAVVTNDKPAALTLADQAVELDPKSPAARLALSYAQQAAFKLDDATASVRKAAELDPDNALIWARLAELDLSAADRNRAQQDTTRAQALDPGLAKTQLVLGFADLVRIDLTGSRTAFSRAIELDPSEPLARLGLGLAFIRQGDLQAGRQEIEIAVSLDPGNSLLRSYMGKAYYEEKRDTLAGTQLEIAKTFDPLDPTPWLYDAIRKQTENRPVEALQDLEKSIDLNDNRAVYRSQFLLDQDQAARRVNQARLYRDLGFDQLALVEAYKSLAIDPGSDSAHRFLADAYSDVERGDITRVSESLQAQLRQPVSIPVVDLLLGTDNLFILRDNGPFRLGTNEFDQLFDRDQVRVSADAVGGTHQTHGDQATVSGLIDKLGYAVSQLHYETNGFSPNNDARKDIYDAFVQGQMTPDVDVQLDLKRSRLQAGQIFLSFEPEAATPTNIKENSDSVRLGGHAWFNSRSDLIWSAVYENRERTAEALPGALFPFTVQDTARTSTGEVQNLLRFGSHQLITGASYLTSNDDYTDGSAVESRSKNAYAYSYWGLTKQFNLEIGLAAEFVDNIFSSTQQQVKRHRLSPKLGMVWSPADGTTIRAAAFSSVRRPFVGSQTVEPTQVAGFNQFFAGFDQFYGDEIGTVSQRVCLAADQKFDAANFAGAEASARKMKVASPDTDYDWRERTARLYWYSAYGPFARSPVFSSWQVSVSLEYQFEKIEHSRGYVGPEGIVDVSTDRIPFTVRLFNTSGLTVGTSTSYVRQRALFNDGSGGPDFPQNASGWITDAFVDFRLPRQVGILSIGAKNLFSRSIDLFKTDPALPVVPSQRFLYARARFVF